VDGRSEITAPDRDLARMLLRLGQPISLAVNKADTGARRPGTRLLLAD
jgi:GTP-binding protein